MTLGQIILSYLIIWSLCVFLTLPFGVRPSENPLPLEARGAPERAHYGRKIAIAAVLALGFTALLYYAVTAEFIHFEE
jgi:predicted secreted protein